MTAKYSQLPTHDPSSDQPDGVPVFDFTSIHNYNYPKYFSYSNSGNKHSKKYKSIFTYSGDKTDEHDIPVAEDATLVVKICAYMVTILCYIGLVLTLPVSAFFCMKNVQQHERYVIFRLGRLLKAKGPGLIIVLPCIDKWTKVDLRMKAFSVPPQMILTEDGGGIEIGAEIYYRIKDPVQSIKSVQDLKNSCRILAQSALHKTIIKNTLNAIETERNKISDLLATELNETSVKWGAEISKVDLSQMKVLQQPPEQSGFMGSNPLSVIGPMLFPPGSSNIPFNQLAEVGQQITKHMGINMAAPVHSQQKMPKLVEIDEAPEGFEEVTINDIPEGFAPTRDLRTPQDLIAAVRPKLSPELIRDFGYIYKFVVTGNNAGTYYLDLKNGCGDVGEGEPPAGMCDVTLTMPSDVLTQLLIGQMSAFSAYMGGAMQVEGDLSAAQQLGNLIDAIK